MLDFTDSSLFSASMVIVHRVSNRLGKSIFSDEKSRSDSSASRKSSSAAIASGPEASTDISNLLEFPDIVHPAWIWFPELFTSTSHQFEINLRHSTVSIATISFSANFHPVVVHQVSGASYCGKSVEFAVTVHTLPLSSLVLRLLNRSTASTNCTPIYPPVLVNQASGASRVVIACLDLVNSSFFLQSSVHAGEIFVDDVIIGAIPRLVLQSQPTVVYGSLPRPPECCYTYCLWHKSTPMVCLWPHVAYAYLFVGDGDDVDVLRYLENSDSRRQGEFWFESYKRNLDFGIVRRWLALWTDNHIFSVTKSGLMFSSSKCIKDSLVMVSYFCKFASFCLFVKTYARCIVALFNLLEDDSHINALLCVSLVSKSIRDGLHELLILLQQMDIPFSCWYFLLDSHHQFCSEMMQKLQKFWTKMRLFLSLVPLHIQVLSTFTENFKELRDIGSHCSSIGFIYGSLPRPPKDHHPSFCIFRYHAVSCSGLLQLQQIVSFVCQKLVDILCGLLFQLSAFQAQVFCISST